MDIQKEREAFDKWANENIAKGRMMNWQEWCWEAWQAAKANAVPEGFVLMPKEPTREIYRTFYDAFYSAAGNTAQCFKVAYKAIVEAQEPSHDSDN